MDELRLFVFPGVVGDGARLFGQTTGMKPFRLASSRPSVTAWSCSPTRPPGTRVPKAPASGASDGGSVAAPGYASLAVRTLTVAFSVTARRFRFAASLFSTVA